MNLVLDASALIALLRGELGAESVRDHIRNFQYSTVAHALNLCEVYYDFCRANGEAIAQTAISDLLMLGIAERSDMSAHF